MRFKRFKTNKQFKIELIESKKKTIYFCHYCNILFQQNTEYGYNSNTHKFICLECNSEPFNHDNYIDYAKTQYKPRDFHVNGNNDVSITENFISNIIVDLRAEGLTINEIISLSHFPSRLVRRLNKYMDIKPKEFLIEDFLVRELGIDSQLVNHIIENTKLDSSDERDCIVKAIQYGCSLLFIAQLFHIRKERVWNISTGFKSDKYVSLNRKNMAFKNMWKLTLKNGIVFLTPKHK